MAVLASVLLWGRPGAQSTIAALAAEHRDPWLWPFAASSPWNTPLGSNAQFAPVADPATQDITTGTAIINAGEWSRPLYRARSRDPYVTVADDENRRAFRVRVPPGATPDPRADAHMYVVDPSKRSVLEMFGARRDAPGHIRTVRSSMVDLYGSGWFLTDGRYPNDYSGMGGLIRVAELKAETIPHALAFLLPPARMKHGPVWPAAKEDYFGFRDYTGHVPIGSLIAIPPTLDLTTLGLSPAGLALARALQDYGAYCIDSSGSDGINISAEGATEGMAELQAMRTDFDRIHPYLRLVTSNGPGTPGGGGTPRREPAPALRPAVSPLPKKR